MQPLPIPVIDAWGNAAGPPLVVLFAVIAVATFAYLWAIDRAKHLNRARFLLAIGVLLAGAIAVPALFSADVYAYLAYGERALAGCDPWGTTTTCASGPLAELARIAWHHDPPRLVYGPLFVVPAALVASLGTLSPLVAIELWRVAMAVAFVVAVARFARLYGMTAAVVVGANPVAIWSVAEGHNDALMLLVVVIALGAKGRAQPVWWIAASAIKGIALLPALWQARKRARTLVAIGALSIACYLPLAFDLARAGGARASTTVAYDLASLIPLPQLAAQALVALALGLVLLTRRARNERVPTAVLIVWCLLPNAYPWYSLWILPVAAIVWGTPSASVLVVAAICSLFRIIPEATIGNDPALRSSLILMQFLPPVVLSAAARLQRKHVALVATLALVTLASACSKSPTAQQQPAPAATAAQSAQGQAPATAPQFAYIVAPPSDANASAGTPRILEIALNAQTLVSPGPVLVRITTTPDVISVIARALGREITIQQASPGVFSGGETIPRVPAFMRRAYEVEIVAANAAGKTARATVPIALR